jgi:hypothetical protein
MLLVMMAGPPGSGKTTLAEGLVGALGPRTFLFGEGLLFEIDEFADVAVAFRTKTTFPDTAMMLDAYSRFVDRVRDDVDVVVFDWSCAGMVEDLPCAQPDRTSLTTHRPEMRSDPEILASHSRDVRSLAEHAVLFVPDVSIATAIGRAHAQRGERWFDGWPEITNDRRDGSFLDAAVRYWEAGAPRKEDCVRAHAAGDWDVVRLDASAPAADVLDAALSVLRGY